MQVFLENLEIHAAHACNLTCESCSHFSNHGHKGVVSLQEAKQLIEPWSKRLFPVTFSILGGEPTINPQLAQFVLLVRHHFPYATIRIVTNGGFLHRHPQLPLIMQKDRNLFLELSVHHKDADYRAYLQPALDLLKEWKAKYDILFKIGPSFRNWTRRYRGEGEQMLPYEDKDPKSSWANCQGHRCRQLFRGKLWKCPPVAYLNLQAEKYKLSEKWDPYLAYNALSPDASDDQLREFLDRDAEAVCNMCSARPEWFELPNPLRLSVSAKAAR